MQQYYQHFSEIDNVYWTNYFLNEFIPKYKFYEYTSDKTSAHIEWHRKDFIQEKEILKLGAELTTKLKFPPIDYFFLIRHNDIDQSIHADGLKVVRNASFNLPLTGYAGTKLCFYKPKTEDVEPTITNANHYNKEDMTVIDSFEGDNRWVLVNTSIPHNAVDINPDNPRIVLCVRFVGNPTFDQLINNAKS